MRFARNVRIFRGQLDPASFAGVSFLLLLFLLLNSGLVFTPGVRVNLPEAADLPGTANPTVVVAVDEGGQYYFRSQVIEPQQLSEKLSALATESKEPLTLIVQADKNVKYEVLVQLGLLARAVGIKDTLLATRPPTVPAPLPVKL